VEGNGHRPARVPQPHGSQARRRIARLYLFAGAIIGVIALAAATYAVFGGLHFGGGWVTVGSVSDVRRAGVFYDRSINAFVIDDDSGELIAVIGESPHAGEKVYYCPSSGWFQSPTDGSTFDHRGYYRLGPAPRGLDRAQVREEHGFISVDVSQRAPGPARGLTDERRAAGPRCSDVPGDPETGRIATGR
jgi:hypothetical protein